jgi:hypothetical protein
VNADAFDDVFEIIAEKVYNKAHAPDRDVALVEIKECLQDVYRAAAVNTRNAYTARLVRDICKESEVGND